MSRVVEISLDLPAVSASEWVQQTSEQAVEIEHTARCACRGASADGVGVAIADALGRVAQLSLVSARQPFVIHRLELGARLAEVGWCATVEASSEGRRLSVSNREPYAPAVTVREIVCDAPLETGIYAAQPDTLPFELQTALYAANDLMAAAPPLALHRTIWRWTAPNGHLVDIVLNDACDADDEDVGTAPHDVPGLRELRLSARCDDDGDASPDAVRQVEDRLVPAVRALFAAADELVGALPVFPNLEGALEGIRRDSHDEEPVRAAPIDLVDARTPHAALIAISSNIVQQWFGNERGVRETAPTEFVHQMRVAQRRLNTALRIFSAWADADWKTHVAPGLKWLGELLGEARDLDVFTDSTLRSLVGADTDPSSWSVVLAAADARRLAARGRLQAAMRSQRHARLSLALLAWLSDLRARGTPEAVAQLTLREFVTKQVRRHFKRLTDNSKLTELDAVARHRHRIEAKRLRYVLEFFEAIASGRTRREVLKTLQRIQSVLGDGNDAVNARAFLEQFEITPYQRGFACGWSQAVNQCTAQEGERLLRALAKPRITGGA